MSVFRLIGLSSLLLLGACASVVEAPQVAMRAPFMPSGVTVDAPQGYVDMCRRDASLCDDAPALVQASADRTPAPADGFSASEDRARLSLISWNGKMDADGAATASDQTFSGAASFNDGAAQAGPMTVAARMDLLNRVNRFVNGNVQQRTDQSMYGVEEYWRRSGVGRGATGDCKDIAIEKRLELIQQGYPARDLFYAVAYRSDIGFHALLVAHTPTGDVVLDSRTPYIVAWTEAPYVWVKRQSHEESSVWVLVNGPAARAPDMRMAALDMNTDAGFGPAQAR